MGTLFVFSNNVKFRLARHAAFWILEFVYQGGLDFIVPTFFEGVQQNVLKESLQLVVLYMPGQMILAYGLLYFIIPNYFLKSRYAEGIFLLILFCALAGLANEVSYRLFFNESFTVVSFGRKHSLGMHRVLGVAGFAACIKYMKFWYEKESLNAILEKEKIKAELQLLKAQVHPHFLFNTLNNIYSVAQKTSPEASDMFLRLSDLLRYILYECNKPEVSISQELKIINDYISLDSIRYTKNLDIQTQFPDDTYCLLITPLLPVPLLDNWSNNGSSTEL